MAFCGKGVWLFRQGRIKNPPESSKKKKKSTQKYGWAFWRELLTLKPDIWEAMQGGWFSKIYKVKPEPLGLRTKKRTLQVGVFRAPSWRKRGGVGPLSTEHGHASKGGAPFGDGESKIRRREIETGNFVKLLLVLGNQNELGGGGFNVCNCQNWKRVQEVKKKRGLCCIKLDWLDRYFDPKVKN